MSSKSSQQLSYYVILGVERTASEDDIKKSFRKLAKEFHPDRNPKTQDQFQQISEAYSVLADAQKRDLYDRFGKKGLEMKQFDGIFEDTFGNGAFETYFSKYPSASTGDNRTNTSGNGESTGSNFTDSIDIPISVTLEELCEGCVKNYLYKRKVFCSNCQGTGGATPNDIFYCKSCKGTGRRIIRKSLPRGIIQQHTAVCSICNGKGQFIRVKCLNCHGRKSIPVEEVLALEIPKGSLSGDSIVFKEKGDEYPGRRSQDLRFILEQVPHPIFSRNGNDLIIKKTISLLDSLVGCSISLETIRKKTVLLNIDRIIKPNHQEIIKGEGVNENGNLIIQFVVEYPTNMLNFTPEEKDLIRNIFLKSKI